MLHSVDTHRHNEKQFIIVPTAVAMCTTTKIVHPQESTVETQPQLQPALLRVSATISQYFTKPSNDVSRYHRILIVRQWCHVSFSVSLGIGRPMVHTPGRCRRQRGLLHVGHSGTLHKNAAFCLGLCACCRPSCWFQVQATHAFIRVACR